MTIAKLYFGREVQSIFRIYSIKFEFILSAKQSLLLLFKCWMHLVAVITQQKQMKLMINTKCDIIKWLGSKIAYQFSLVNHSELIESLYGSSRTILLVFPIIMVYFLIHFNILMLFIQLHNFRCIVSQNSKHNKNQ